MNKSVSLLFVGVIISGLLAFSQSTRRIAVPRPILFMYGHEKLTGQSQFWANSAQYKAEWDKVIGAFNVIDGNTQDASLVKNLRAQGKIFARHVSNTKDAKHQTPADFVADWSKPFEDTLGGALPGGFDAICIDEFHSLVDGTPDSQLQVEALREIRNKYPDRLIFASGVWKLADGGNESKYGSKSLTYDNTLNAINQYADVFVLENYQRTGNPQLDLYPSMAANLQKHSPGLLQKTIYALYISQSAPYIADDNKQVDFPTFLEQQIKLIKTNSVTQSMPGVAFWVFYRAKPATIDAVVSISKKYY